MKKMVFAALFALVSVASAQSSDGWGAGRGMGYGGIHGMGHGRGMGRGMGRGDGMMAMLDLDSATAVKVAKLHDEHQKNRIALRAKLETARVEFRAAMRKDPVDEKSALSKQKEISSIREQMQTSALEHRFAVAKLLTPEQREMLRDHARRGRMMDHDGEGGGHRRGYDHSRMDHDEE